ncbi:MAG: carbohydrate kinase [Thermoleophilia bacterium]
MDLEKTLSASTGRVTVIGEALIDLVADPSGAGFTAHPGGSPYNVAVGLARLGVPTSLMARLGDNAFGRLLRSHAEAEGVDLGPAARAAEPTTLAVVTLDARAHATYDFYLTGTADWQWTGSELAAFPPDTAVLHFGSVAAWMPPGDAHVVDLARRVKAAGSALVSYDPNVRPGLLGDPASARARIERCVAQAHLVKTSAEDLAWLYPDTPADAVAADWLARSPTVVVVTDGPEGASLHRSGAAPVRRPGITVAVADTVGAGDSFTSAMLASLLGRGVDDPGRLVGCPEGVLIDAVDDAIRASAWTCGRAGADPPTAADLASSTLD